ncbi:ExbD/TolR family protein [Leadbettera azotonutricia]|uniref:Putative biopolymer transport ExbD protein n=1 Tax=Leadbettera azotonutricia (strain ATCC BAA-888 / DSM 13862 / ZAS-9) TaxID=545695 RepID=F5YCT7_LEAAZ|nr:biopolymer transporter ExbD [Leadbettera azotonutricia]AEF82076.1 putative biopolymer transport ExbD protein [Leadbettera azotonutricia ZAS-9]
MKLARKQKNFIVPLNSMSDVAFLLLIFIMLVSLINYRKEVKIDYPEAETAKKTSAEKNLEIWVDRFGSLYLDGDLCDINTIEAGIVNAYQNAPDTRVHIIADRDTPFEHIHKVLEILQILQYRVVSFVVKDA